MNFQSSKKKSSDLFHKLTIIQMLPQHRQLWKTSQNTLLKDFYNYGQILYTCEVYKVTSLKLT